MTSNLPADTTFAIPILTEDFVNKQLACLKTNKAAGDDGISAAFLRECNSPIVPTLFNILNTSIETGVFPNRWRSNCIVQELCFTDVNNYRPISVLNSLSKILERHVYNCFMLI